jgi:hypothetical protein
MPELSRPLPAEDRLVLLPKNPGAFFVFWQLSASREDSFRAGVFSPEIEVRLLCCEDSSRSGSHKCAWLPGRAYVAVPPSGGTFQASLYALRNGAWEKLLESNPAAAPSAAGRAEDRAYASLEFHKRVSP